MKRLLFIAFLAALSLLVKAQVKPTNPEFKIEQTPYNKVWGFNKLDSTQWGYSGYSGWQKFFTAKTIQQKIDSLAASGTSIISGDLTESIGGLQFSAVRQVLGGTTDLQLSSGYGIPTTAQMSAWTAKQNAITTGTTAQYFRGDLSLATFPTIPTNTNQLTNGAGFTTNTGSVVSVGAGNGMTQTGFFTTDPVLNIVSHTGASGSIGTVNVISDAIGVDLGNTSITAFRGDYGNAAYTNMGKMYLNSSYYFLNNDFFQTYGGSIIPVIETIPTQYNLFPISSGGVFTALGLKQNTLTLTTTGTIGAATLIGSTLNIPQYSGGGGGYWQQLTGAIAPLTLTDEVRLSSTTDYGAYKLQMNGKIFIGDNSYATIFEQSSGDFSMKYDNDGSEPTQFYKYEWLTDVTNLSSVVKIIPRPSAPSSPSAGWIYVNSTDNHVYIYLNGAWRQMDN